MKLSFETDLEKSLVQERFRRAGLGGVQSSWRALNEIRDTIGRYVKVANIKLVNAVANAISPDLLKGVELNLDAILQSEDDMLKAIGPRKVRPTSASLLRYEGEPPTPNTDGMIIHIRQGEKDIKPEDYQKIDDVVFYYLNGNAQPAMIDAVTQAYRLGMKTGDMSEMKMPDKKIADMSLGDIDDWEGSTAFIKRLKADGIADEYAFASQWAKENAMTSIAIYDENGDRAGKAYETIMRMFRDHVAYTLSRGEDVSKLRSRLIFPERWTDVEGHQHSLADQLTPSEMRQYTIAHLNRDWDRLAFDQVQRAFQAGRLTRWAATGLPVYAKFWRVRNKGKQCDKCRQWQGTILRVFKSEQEFQESEYYGGDDIVIGDERAKVAAWPGKSNDDRKHGQWWVCAPTHPHCVSSDTEVYTDSGWKRFKDVQDGDLIYSMNHTTGELSFVGFSNKIAYHHKGDMYHFSGYTIDQLVTEEHRVPIIERKRERKGETKYIRSFSTAINLVSKAEYFLPRTGFHKGIVRSERMKIIAEIIGWYVAEGTKHSNKDAVYLIQTKQSGRDKICSLLDSIGVPYRIHKQGVYVKGSFGKYLHDQVPHKSPYRKVPEWIKKSDTETISAFLDGYRGGDGSQRINSYNSEERVYHTSSRQLVSDISEMIYKVGKYANFRTSSEKGHVTDFKNGTYASNHSVITISECSAERSLFGVSCGNTSKVSVVQYDDMVYCLTLEENGVMLIRRNGKSSWTGNCNDDYIMA